MEGRTVPYSMEHGGTQQEGNSMPDQSWSGDDRRHENSILSLKIDQVQKDLTDLKEATRELTSAVSRLAVVEDRQSRTSETMNSNAKAIMGLDNRIRALESASAVTSKTTDDNQGWIKAALVALLTGVIGWVLSTLFHRGGG